MSGVPEPSSARFRREFKQLDRSSKAAFFAAYAQLISDLERGTVPALVLRVKQVVNSPDVWEFTWARNGRATFSYTDDGSGLVLRRVGGHDIFRRP
ncbi:MAG: hypothetical protein DLM55_06730 [Acidimicrobiales bacterium]|nr:MAG: hypothetical protein DLM55_06730 [Acidimicrobiales bacterium]